MATQRDVEVLITARKSAGGDWAYEFSGERVAPNGDIDLRDLDGPVQMHFHLLTPNVRFRTHGPERGAYGHGAISIRRHQPGRAVAAAEAESDFDEHSRRTFAGVQVSDSNRVSTEAQAAPRPRCYLRLENQNDHGTGRFHYSLYFETEDGRESFALDPLIIDR